MASIVYCEHDGVWRQWDPINGDSVSWYKRIGSINILLMIRMTLIHVRSFSVVFPVAIKSLIVKVNFR